MARSKARNVRQAKLGPDQHSPRTRAETAAAAAAASAEQDEQQPLSSPTAASPAALIQVPMQGKDMELNYGPRTRILYPTSSMQRTSALWSDPQVADLVAPPTAASARPSRGRPSKRKHGKGTGVKLSATSGTAGRLSYRLLGIGKEAPSGKVGRDSVRKFIYGVAFSPFCTSRDIFATCGDTKITIYEAAPDIAGAFQAMVSYHAEDECFYSLDWSLRVGAPNTNLLVAAGASGIIRLLTVGGPEGTQKQEVLGWHGHAVNDVKVHRANPELLATGSADHAVRLWNIRTKVLVAVFGGADGPRNEVVSISFHSHYPLLAATGIDHTIHIWNFGREKVQEAMKKAAEWHCQPLHRYKFPTFFEHMPHWATRDIHSNFSDCIAWWGDWLISRSVEEKMVFWRCGRTGEKLMDLKYEFDWVDDVRPFETKDKDIRREKKTEQTAPVKKEGTGAKARVSKMTASGKQSDKSKQATSPEEKEKEIKEEFEEGEVELKPPMPPTPVASHSHGTRSKSPKKAETTTVIKEEEDEKDIEALQLSADAIAEANTKKVYIEKAKKPKSDLGPPVRIAKKFTLSKSDSWYMRFGLDYEQKLLGFGNCAGDVLLYYLGTAEDNSFGWSFADVKQVRIPAFSSIHGHYIRQTAFNNTGEIMVTVTDECFIALYRIWIHPPKPKVTRTKSATRPPLGNSITIPMPEEEEKEAEADVNANAPLEADQD